MHVLRFGNKLNEEVCRGFIFANLWWNVVVANLATNFQDLVAKVKNLVALVPVLGAISRPVRPNFLWQDCTVHALCIFCLTTCFLAASCGDILKNDNNKNQTFEGRLPANPGGSNKCVWIIVVQRGIIELAFKDRFQVTSLAQDCKENYVQVQDGRYRYNTMKCSAIRAELYTKIE